MLYFPSDGGSPATARSIADVAARLRNSGNQSSDVCSCRSPLQKLRLVDERVQNRKSIGPFTAARWLEWTPMVIGGRRIVEAGLGERRRDRSAPAT
jgi:hypothetical protein